MRELTVRIEFTSPSLGNKKIKDDTPLSGRFVFARSPDGHVMFLPTWWQANMNFAASVQGRHQKLVKSIHWDAFVDGNPKRRMNQDGSHTPIWYSRRYGTARKQRYSLHEAFHEGQIVGINCVVPPKLDDDSFKRLMTTVGQYKGISPFKPGEFGMFRVASLQPRKAPEAEESMKLVIE
jgi:hypothetical protein